MVIRFGTGGWRVPQEDFTPENIYKVVNGIGAYIIDKYTWCFNKKAIQVVIGYDNRDNSLRAAIEAFNILKNKYDFTVKVFSSSVSTPTTMKYVADKDFDLGIMITASHNPANFNGIKVIDIGGRDATVQTTSSIECFCNSSEKEDVYKYTYITDTYLQNKINAYEYEQKYVKGILSDINVDKIKKKNFNIVFDNMHGSGSSLFYELTSKLNVKSEVLNFTGVFKDKDYVPCPTEQNNENVSKLIKENPHKYDFGISFDGDGDRLGIIDEFGNFIDGNDMLCLFAWYLYSEGKIHSPVAVSCCSTDRVSAIASSYGYSVVETPIGVKYLVDEILNNEIEFAGEQNGGVIFPKHLLGKDSICTFAMLLDMLAVTDKTLSELIDFLYIRYGKTYCISEQVRYVGNRDNIKKLIENHLPKVNKKIQSTIRIDGVKLYFDNNDFLMYRLSGTEPTIRILVESPSEQQSKEYVELCKKFFKELGVI